MAGSPTWAPSPLVISYWLLSRGNGLFFTFEVVDDGEEETADRANETYPIMKFHCASPPSFEEESRTANYLPRKILSHVHKIFNVIID